MFVSIDPGKHWCGVAGWYGGSLVFAGLVKNFQEVRETVKLFFPDGVATCFVELPQVYPQSPVDPNDLIAVAFAAGQASAIPGVRLVHTILPREWKGQVKKEVMTARIKSRLYPDESDRVFLPRAEKTLAHNVYDAIGIGLKVLGRL